MKDRRRVVPPSRDASRNASRTICSVDTCCVTEEKRRFLDPKKKKRALTSTGARVGPSPSVFPRARRDGGCGARHRREGWPSRVLPGEDRGVRARREGQDLEPAAPRGAEERAQPERCVKPLSARRRRCLERVSDLNATDRGTGGWLALFGDAHAHARPGRDTAARTPRNRGDAPPGPRHDRPPASRHGSHHPRSLANLKGSFRCSYFCGFRGPDARDARGGNQKHRKSRLFLTFFSLSRLSSGRLSSGRLSSGRLSSGRLSSQSALCARRSSTCRSPGRTWARW